MFFSTYVNLFKKNLRLAAISIKEKTTRDLLSSKGDHISLLQINLNLARAAIDSLSYRLLSRHFKDSLYNKNVSRLLYAQEVHI